MDSSMLQKKAEMFLNLDVYPLLKNFPQAEKFSLCQDMKQACYRLIRAAVMANNLRSSAKRRLEWLENADAEKSLILVLIGTARTQKYITKQKALELQAKAEELGRIIGGLQKYLLGIPRQHE